MSNFTKQDIINNLKGSDLIKIIKEDANKMYIAQRCGGDRRDEIYVTLESGVMRLKKIQNGEYRIAWEKLGHLVNDVVW